MAQVDLYQYINEVKTLLSGNRPQAAAVHCQHILRNYPRHMETYRLLARSLLARRQYADAADLYQRILSADPTDLNALTSMAQIARTRKEDTTAARYLELALELDPYNDSLKSRLTDIYQKQKRDVPPVGISQAGLGVLHFRSRLYRQAISSLTAVLREQPERLDLLVILAEAYWRLDKHVEAVKICLEILDKLPNCIKANAILAEIWLRTDKIAGAQKPLHLVQSLTLPAQNHLDADMPEGRAFLIRDSVNIPKQIAVEYLDNVHVEEAGIYDTDNDWENDLGFEDDYLGVAQGGREEVEVDFFALLESAEAEDVFAFDETAEEHFDNRNTGWLTDSSPSGQRASALMDSQRFAVGGEEGTDFQTADVFEQAAGDMPDWMSEMDAAAEATGSGAYDQPDDVPTWLNETGELHSPFGSDNVPAWLEEATQEQELDDSSDLFMTDEELAGLWQHEEPEDAFSGPAAVDEAASDRFEEDEFAFLESDAERNQSPFSGTPSLVNDLMEGSSDSNADDTFSFLDMDEDGTGDGFADWLTATGANLESPVAPNAAADDDFSWFEEEPGAAAVEPNESLSHSDEPSAFNFEAADEDMFGGDANWLSELTSEQEPLPSITEEDDEADSHLELFAFSAMDQEGEEQADMETADQLADDDLLDFAFSSTDELSNELDVDLAADLDNFAQDDSDIFFGEEAPDWLSEVSDSEQDASILSQQHTARLLMPEGEDAPAWLLDDAAEVDTAADSDKSKEDSDKGEIGTAEDMAWLNNSESSSPASESTLDDSWLYEDDQADSQDLTDWFSKLDAAASDKLEEGDTNTSMAPPDWVANSYPLGELEDDSEPLSQTPPAWLSEPNEGEQSDEWFLESNVDEAEEDDSLPDWMSTASLETPEAAADWLSDFTTSEDEASDDDWLSEMSLDAAAIEEEAELPSEVVSRVEATEEDSLAADWLSDFTPSEGEEGDDDWLSEMSLMTLAEEEADDDSLFDAITDTEAVEEQTSTTDELHDFATAADEDEEGTNWLSEMSLEGENLEETQDSNWLAALEDDTVDELQVADTDEVTTPDWMVNLAADDIEDTELEKELELDFSAEVDFLSELADENASLFEETVTDDRAATLASDTDVGLDILADEELNDEDEGGLPDWLRGSITEDARTIETGQLNPALVSQGFNRQAEEEEPPDWLMAADEDDDSGMQTTLLNRSYENELRDEETAVAAEKMPEWLDEVSTEMADASTLEEENDLSGWLDDIADTTEDESTSDAAWVFDVDSQMELTNELSFEDEEVDMLFGALDSSAEEALRAAAFDSNNESRQADIFDEEEMENEPVDWLTGLPVNEATTDLFDEQTADELEGLFEDEQLVTDWLTGQVVDKEDQEFHLPEITDSDEDEFADDELPAWAQESETDAIAWLTEMESKLEKSEDDPSELSLSLKEESAVADDTADSTVSLADLEADVADDEAMPEDMTFFDFSTDDDPDWLKMGETAADEEEASALAELLEISNESAATPNESDLPDWFDGMLDELGSEKSEIDQSAVITEATVSSSVVEVDDFLEEDALEWSDTVLEDEVVDEQLNDLAEGMAELAADSYLDEAGEFDDRPLLETTEQDDLSEWLMAETVLGDDLDTAVIDDSESLLITDEENAVPDWLLDDSFLEDESNELLEDKQKTEADLEETVVAETKTDDLEDVLSWLEAIALSDEE